MDGNRFIGTKTWCGWCCLQLLKVVKETYFMKWMQQKKTKKLYGKRFMGNIRQLMSCTDPETLLIWTYIFCDHCCNVSISFILPKRCDLLGLWKKSGGNFENLCDCATAFITPFLTSSTQARTMYKILASFVFWEGQKVLWFSSNTTVSRMRCG